jgi:pSer/pThr/pTyr-binding forkhead associated (FHA) protein
VDPADEVREDEIGKTQPFKPLKEMTAVRPGSGAVLTVDAGPDRGKVFALKRFPQTLGRHAEIDIVLNDSSVSRRHARLERQGGRCVITDLGSTNGVKVNGVKIERMVLTSGDVVTLGTTVFTFKVE